MLSLVAQELGVFFVLTPKALLALFVRAEDRAYFARPVRVLATHKDGGLVYVTDPVRGDSYPVDPRHLRRSWDLTRRQLSEAQDSGGASAKPALVDRAAVGEQA